MPRLPPAAFAKITAGVAPYVVLNHLPAGGGNLDIDAQMFVMGASGISRSENVTAETMEVVYPDLVGNVAAPVGQDILCGLNTRFGVDPSRMSARH